MSSQNRVPLIGLDPMVVGYTVRGGLLIDAYSAQPSSCTISFRYVILAMGFAMCLPG